MASEKEDAMEKALQTDQVADPQRDSVQPDMDPGVIDVEEEAIDVEDAEEEEEEEQKSSGDENANVVNLVSPSSGAGPQADVDVIDLEEAEEDGEEGGVEEEGSRVDDFVRDDVEEDANGAPDNEKDGVKERVSAEEANQNGSEAAQLKEQEVKQVAIKKEPDDKQLAQTSESQQKQPSTDVSKADMGFEKDLGESSSMQAGAGERERTSTVPPARIERDRDTDQLVADGEEPQLDDSKPPQDLSQDFPKKEGVVGKVQPSEQNEAAAKEAPESLPQAESGDNAIDENGADAHGEGPGTSEGVANAVQAPAEETASSMAQDNQNEEGKEIISQPKSDADDAAPEIVRDRADADAADKAEPEVATDNSLPVVAPLKEDSAIESSGAKPEDAMDLDDAEEEDHEDAAEEEHENMEDENGNADMELSEEEPAHDLRADGDEESEPPTATNESGGESLTTAATDHEPAELSRRDATQGVINSEKEVESTTRMELDSDSKGRAEQRLGQTPMKEDEDLKPPGLAEATDVQLSGATENEDANASKHAKSDTKTAADSNLPADEDIAVSASPSGERPETEIVSSEAADGLGGSPSANLTAPLFGMRPSGFPAQPVSFRTPPSFQRTSLSPNARPFIPAAHREAMRIAALRSAVNKDEIASADGPVPMDSEVVKETPTASVPEAKEKEDSKLLFSPQQLAAPLQMESEPVQHQESVSAPSTLQPADVQAAKQSATQENVVSADTLQPTLPVQPQPSANESKLVSARKALPLKVKKDAITKPDSKTQGKKVTFSLSHSKAVESSEPQTAPPHSESSVVVSESVHEGRPEEQKLKEENSDDGSMYEVSHVPVSVRIGNGNVMKRDSLSTVRLTVAKHGEAKLEMFKEGASSLSLFESLSASRNILRVRKVSNRPVMTVALMSNNNGGSQVAKKYFLHLGHHLYDKVFKACVAHLNSTGPNKRTGGMDSAASVTSATKRLSTPIGSDVEDIQATGIKRSVHDVRTADPKRLKAAEKRRMLQETKAKLLENLKATRKKKAGSGAGEKDHGSTDKAASIAASVPGIATHNSTAKPPTSQVVPKTPLQSITKVEAQKSAATFGSTGAVKSLNQGIQNTKPGEGTVQTPLAGFEKRKLLADKHAQSVRQKDISQERMQTDSLQKGAPKSEGGLLTTSGSSLKRKKPVGSMSAQPYAHGKRSLDQAKSTDLKRQRIGSEKNASLVGASVSAQEKLKALREQIKAPSRGVSAKNMMTSVASATKSAVPRPSFDDMEEVKKIRTLTVNLTKEKEEMTKKVAVMEEQKKKMEAEVERLQKELSKANSETAESRSEVARLRMENKTAEKNVAETVESLKKSGQELKELWKKVSDTLEVVKTAEEAARNDQENEEEKKISLSRCDHDNVLDFFYRLRSFKASTWPVEEEDIGALACARHGWYNSGVNELKSSEGVTLVLGDLFESADAYERKIEEMKTALVQKHALLSGWRGKQCARDIGKELLSKERLEKNVAELRSCTAMKRVRGFAETARNLCELAAACGWRATEWGVRCEWCAVEVRDVHLRESHFGYCLLAREAGEVRRNVELLGLDWEVEGARLGYFFRSSYGDTMEEG